MTSVLSPWKSSLLGAYYYATLPARLLTNQQVARSGNAPVMSIYYHRVADHAPNDWTISNSQFKREIEWLEANFDLVSLEEAQRRIREGNDRAAVCITFDDGYAENCDEALPLLISKRIPCTYFVSSHFVMTGDPFPHDVETGKPLPPNTPEQLRSLVASGISIGAHTRTHPNLGPITDHDVLHDEIVGGRIDLEDLFGIEIEHFAFPFGLHKNLNAAAIRIAAENRFIGVCSAYGGYNLPGDDSFHIQRIHADPDIIRLKNWLTVDPRKVRQVERYQYHNEQQALASTNSNLPQET